MDKISLTGIKPTGTPHLGNYLGAIRPALELQKEYKALYFIADYHAINTIKDPSILKQYTYEVASTWLACGLDTDKNVFYKQSSVPEIFELATILGSFTAKGLMNRAHAYKAKVADNKEQNKEADYGVNMGLFVYPLLMASDILTFNADVVPVGKDQLQHLEMCNDIAQSVNFHYSQEVLKLPEAKIVENTQTVIGLDGRKMSKSYGNTIPLFLPEKKLRKLIMKIKTTSQDIEEPKDPDTCNVFSLYTIFSTPEEQEALKVRYRNGGMGWGEAKEVLFEKVNQQLSPFRDRYDELMSDKAQLDIILKEGGQKARQIASERMDIVRKTIGVS